MISMVIRRKRGSEIGVLLGEDSRDCSTSLAEPVGGLPVNCVHLHKLSCPKAGIGMDMDLQSRSILQVYARWS